MNYQLRPYSETDKEFIYYVKKIVYKAYVEMNWGEWDELKQRDMFDEFIATFEKEIKIIIIDGKLAGFFHGHYIDDYNYEQANICILPAFQGKGVGTSILKSIIEQHQNQNIHLRCFKQNPVVNLYKRLGFEIVEELSHHYKMVLKNN